jgi:tripeptide aminopeptidase
MMATSTDPIHRLAELPAVARARRLLHETDDAIVQEQCTIAMIPSPPFGERERGEWLHGRFEEIGLEEVRADGTGNILGSRSGTQKGAEPVIIAAHLDTVFPIETKLDLRRENGRVLAPGIADNARGLATLLAVARVIVACDVAHHRPLLFVGSVGEEGLGDLRGVKALFDDESPLRNAAAFIALDGTESRRVVSRAIGSVRYRIVMRGPGGHSWADRGAPNAAHAIGSAIAALSRLRLPAKPAWSVNVGRIGGGTSINAIPEDAWFELDLRSEDPATLDRLDADAMDGVRMAARDVNAHRRRGSTALHADIALIGRRPAGETPMEHRLVQAARGATHYIGRRAELVASSTDANVPMSLGIPSIAIGGGGESGGMHTLGEWYENTAGADGIVRALLTIVAAAGETENGADS